MHTRVKLLGEGGADEDHIQIIGGDAVKLLGDMSPPSPPGFGTPDYGAIYIMYFKNKNCSNNAID